MSSMAVDTITNAAGTGAVAITGTTTGTGAAAGSVGEVILSRVTNASPVSITSGTPKNITAITLTAGNWLISGNADIDLGGGTFSNGITQVSLTANANAPTSTRGCPSTGGEIQLVNFTVGTGEVQCGIPAYNVNITTTTTFNLVQLMNSSGTLTAQGFLQAVRIH